MTCTVERQLVIGVKQKTKRGGKHDIYQQMVSFTEQEMQSQRSKEAARKRISIKAEEMTARGREGEVSAVEKL